MGATHAGAKGTDAAVTDPTAGDQKLPVYTCGGMHCKGKNPGEAPHPCPYQVEINDSTEEEFCTCCSECTQECLWDI